MRITKEDRKAIGWGPVYETRCPYCGSEPGRPCIRISKLDGSKYRDWNFHTARRDAAILNQMYIIPEETHISDLVRA